MAKRFRELKKQTSIKDHNRETRTHVKSAYIVLRIKALIVDLFMIYVPILYIITYIFMDGKDDFQSSQLAPFVATLLYGLIYAAFISRTGQTPGKKAYEIKVISSKNNEKISFLQAFLRFFAFIFTATTLLGVFLPFLREDKKMLHDLILSTEIVEFKTM